MHLILFSKGGRAFLEKRKIFSAVFVMYPGEQGYADHYFFRFRQENMRFKPRFAGFITHPDGRRTLSLAITANDKMFLSGIHEEVLKQLHEEVLGLARRICKEGGTTHFAGILPGVFARLKVRRDNVEQQATAENVVRAITALRKNLHHGPQNIVTILGSLGFVGREVVRLLGKNGVTVYGVDKHDFFVAHSLNHIVVDISTPDAIKKHMKGFTARTVVLNEVYPPPSGKVLEELKEKVVRVYHLAGVNGESFPAFPFGYGNAAPCCAAIPGLPYEIVIERLS